MNRKFVSVPEEVVRPASVRDRILDVATEMFYREGVRAVGVDLIVERSGVAKTSLYRHFPAKDDLIAAFLQREDTAFFDYWDKIASRHKDDPKAELEAHLKWITNYIGGPNYRGCAFLNVATEFPSPEHPAHGVALANKVELLRRLGELTKRMKVSHADRLADQIALLIDGAFVNGQLLGKKGPARSLLSAALALISAAVASSN